MLNHAIKIFILSLCLSFSVSIFADEQIAYMHDSFHLDTIQNSKSILHWAQDNLPQNGVLKQDEGGFVYLKVDDGYINQLFPKLSNREYTKPPYFRRPDAPRAHISVFYKDERAQTGEIKEMGQTYSFILSHLALVPPKTHQFIVLEVNSPELEQLRKKYGLSPLLKGHNFNITIAKKKRHH